MRRLFPVLAGLYLFLLHGPVSAQQATDPEALWNEATVYRDSYGTPHVHASTVRGMAFAFGYAQAEDHLETMLMAYRVALGRAAAVGGETFAESDAFAIKIDNADTSRAAMLEADDDTRALCEGFALGVNAWILEHENEVPAWVEGVQPVDVLAYWHFLMVTSAPFDLPGVYQPERPFQRGNAWALAPSNTLDGKTLLVMSPSQYYRAPFQWYEAHLMLGTMNWAGATLIGVPVLMMGHNARLGWGLTPNDSDIADMFREDIAGENYNPNDPNLPAIMAEVAPILSFMSSAKSYYVQTGGGLEERVTPSYIGARGPMLESADGGLYSWRNGAYGQFGGLLQLLRMGQSSDLASFQEAMLAQQLPCFQVVYGDGAGNLFYLYNARTGHRSLNMSDDLQSRTDWAQPVDAELDRLAWSTIVPSGQLPFLENPPAGFIQACGTSPWLATANSGFVSSEWPRWLVPEVPSYRSYRVGQILSSGAYNFDDMAAMLYDTLVPAATDMVPLMIAMAKSRPEVVGNSHPDLLTGLTLLENWDLSSDSDNEALAFYSQWWSIMKDRYQPDFESEAALYRGLLANSPEAQSSVLAAAADAARAMRNQYNRLAIPWSELHRLRRGTREAAISGTAVGDPIFQTGTRFVGRGPVDFGYGFAMAVEFDETPRAMSIVPFGASEDPKSPHHRDQMDLFLERRMKPTHFSYDAVIQQATKGYGRNVVLGVPELEGFCSFRTAMPGTVSMEAVAYPPRPYPSGMAPFTPVVRPVLDDDVDEVAWELSWYVPESACSPENLSRLHIYTYTRDDGWQSLLRQRFDNLEESFTGSGSGKVMLAIMGPSDFLIAPKEKEDPAISTGDAIEVKATESGAFATPTPADGGAPAMALGSGTPTPVVVDGSGTPTTSTAPEQVQPEAPTRRLYDIEFMNPADETGAVPQASPEEKKGLRGFLKKIRGRE